MTEEDIPSVKELNSKLFPLSYSDETYKRYCTPTYLSLLLFIGDEEKTLIGECTAIRVWKNKTSSKRDGYISTFGILEGYRNKGYGTILLNVATYILANHFSCEHIMLDMMKEKVDVFNFYKKNGFIGNKVKSGYYNINGKQSDAILMAYNAAKNGCKLAKHENLEFDESVQTMLSTKNKVFPIFPSLFCNP